MTFDIVIALDTVVMRSCLIVFYCLFIPLHVVVFFLLTVYVYSYIQHLAASVFIKFSVSVSVPVRGRARREAARRRRSEWKVNLGIDRNSSLSNGSWQMTPKSVSFSIVEPPGIWTCLSLQ